MDFLFEWDEAKARECDSFDKLQESNLSRT